MSLPIARRPLHELNDDEAVQWLWLRGRRTALLGLLIAIGVVVMLGGTLAVLFNWLVDSDGPLTGPEAAGTVVRVVGLVAFGPAAGLMLTNLGFSDWLTATGGAGIEGKRIHRAVFRSLSEHLAGQDSVRAARYAPLAAASARFQVVLFAVFYLALILQQVPQLIQGPSDGGIDLRLLNVVLIVAVLITYCFLLPLQLRAAARATRYAQTHPFDRAVQVNEE